MVEQSRHQIPNLRSATMRLHRRSEKTLTAIRHCVRYARHSCVQIWPPLAREQHGHHSTQGDGEQQYRPDQQPINAALPSEQETFLMSVFAWTVGCRSHTPRPDPGYGASWRVAFKQPFVPLRCTAHHESRRFAPPKPCAALVHWESDYPW